MERSGNRLAVRQDGTGGQADRAAPLGHHLAGQRPPTAAQQPHRLGTSGGPPFTGDTSLFQFFGYFGLFCATTLILRVIVAIMHDGLS